MKAALFHGPSRGLAIEEATTPVAQANEVLVRIAACGVCHTDLHYLDHGTPTFKQPPLILGHEIAGTVEAVGSAVKKLKEGDHVLLPAVLPCGSCTACRSGRENICEHGIMLGNNVDGGYAEYIAIDAHYAFPLPPEIPLVEGCIIADALTTPFHAVVRRGQVQPGDWVVVVGCGGIGANIVQVAAALGAQVIAIDSNAKKLGFARQLGAMAGLLSTPEARLDKEIRAISGGGVDVAFEAIGHAPTQQLALAALKTGGRLVLVGYSPDVMALNAGRVMFRELEVIGSLGCRPVDYPRVIELVRQGRIRLQEIVTHRFQLDQINDAFDLLRRGDALRAVVVP